MVLQNINPSPVTLDRRDDIGKTKLYLKLKSKVKKEAIPIFMLISLPSENISMSKLKPSQVQFSELILNR